MTTKHYTTGRDLTLSNPLNFNAVEYQFYVTDQLDLFDKNKGKIEIDVVHFGVMQCTETLYYYCPRTRFIALNKVEDIKRSYTTSQLNLVN